MSSLRAESLSHEHPAILEAYPVRIETLCKPWQSHRLEHVDTFEILPRADTVDPHWGASMLSPRAKLVIRRDDVSLAWEFDSRTGTSETPASFARALRVLFQDLARATPLAKRIGKLYVGWCSTWPLHERRATLESAFDWLFRLCDALKVTVSIVTPQRCQVAH